MKNRNTSSQDKDKLELLIAAGIENVTAVKNGIVFNGEIPLCFDDQIKLNEVYRDAVDKRSNQFKIKYYIEQKTKIIKRASCSRDIAQEISSAVDNYYWECESDTFAVADVPYGIENEIENLLAVLSDLAKYTRSQRSDDEVSEDIAYIAEFWKDEEVSEYEDEAA
jgi:hypothetical protein